MRVFAIVAALVALLGAAPVHAQYPDKPIRVVAPFAPGGNVDVTARLLASKLKDLLGQTVVVENKPGAGGLIGGEQVARSAPDGYTLMVAANSLVLGPVVYGRAPYDWRRDFQPISLAAAVPLVLVVHPSAPVKSLADVIALARTSPDKIPIATAGAGTTNHLAIARIGGATNVEFTLVHYKGSGPASVDVIAGQVPAQIDQLSTSLPHIRAGKLRALAVTSAQRVPQLPDVPTVMESGVAGLADYDAVTFAGLFAPAKIPADVLARLNAAMASVLRDPEIAKRFDDLGAQPQHSTPEAFAAMLEKEDRIWSPLIRKLGIKAE
jgi:tripartite-type tricarboxylate transporter receptor subunit TctC